MLAGFPKSITTVKLARGHYRITREDGYGIEVRYSTRGDWYQTSNMVRAHSLRAFEMNMRNGYMAYDQISK